MSDRLSILQMKMTIFFVCFSALRLQNGSYVMNGHRRLNRAGDFSAGGTTFTYRKREGVGCPGECVRAKGPVNQTIDVQVTFINI